MLKTSIGVPLAALMTLTVAAGVSAAGMLDQAQEHHDGGSWTLSDRDADRRLAQTFTAGITGALDQVDLLLNRLCPPGPLTIEIRTVESGMPTGTVLGSGSVPDTLADQEARWIAVPLSTPASVTAGTQYAIVAIAPSASECDTPTGPAAGSYGWLAADSDVYGAGAPFSAPASESSWTTLGERELTFRTYVTGVAIASAAPSAVAIPNTGVASSPGVGMTVIVAGVLLVSGGVLLAGSRRRSPERSHP